ncbi:hypothetical protein [Taibaiella koreensis]|uniref:hypothetical protein n=1 Tax=Taibaiella koreensis TaxID=1268548 RepID=UPI000E59EF6F|nr:hypothetical protein [Taibaiella koreensis]
MNNSGTITETPASLTIEARVAIPLYLKVILVLFFVLAAMFTALVMNMVAGDSAKALLGVTLLGGALLFFCGRYVLWNIAGSEVVTVSAQSICYYRRYGAIGRPARVIMFQTLATNIETVKQEKDITWGTINFYDRNAITMQLQHIFSSAVYLPIEQLAAVQQKLAGLFERQQAGQWLSFSLN